MCRAVCLGFAGWTLCSHTVVFAGGSLTTLMALFALLAVTAGVAVRLVRRRTAVAPPPRTAPVAEAAAEPPGLGFERARWIGLGAGALAALVALRSEDPIVLWIALLAVLLPAGVVFLALEPPRVEAPRRGRALEVGLWALAALCAVYALVVHRPDADDAFYVNLAVAAIDRPDLPLLAVDTMHGRDDLPIHFPAYRSHSYELALAALSKLTGIPPIYAFHWVAAALAAALVPLAYAVLFRRLSPRVWLAATAALVVVLAAPGETHRWYGNFALVRIWQGKGVFLFVFVPLVYAWAIRFALRPTAASWLLLASAQIAAVGCSSSAIWAAPAAAFAAMASVLRFRLEDLRRFGLGALASGYVLLLGLAMKGDMTGYAPTLKRIYEPGALLGQAVERVLGNGPLQAVGVAAVLVAWACCPRGLARRFAIAVPLAVTVVLLDPFTDAWVRANVTGPSFWRAMWALPIPLLIALVCIAPLQWERPGLPRLGGRVAALAAVVAFALLVPRSWGASADNQASLSWPRLKVEPENYRWAMLLNEAAPGQRVVAPPSVGQWVVTARHHAYPLMVRVYLRPNKDLLGPVAYRDRTVMTFYVAGEVRHPSAAEIFERGLGLWDVRAVCLRNSRVAEEARAILRRRGFRRRVQGVGMEIWVRA